MKTILKYELPSLETEQKIIAPVGACPLAIGTDVKKNVCLWCLADGEVTEAEVRLVFLVEDGKPVPADAKKYLNTIVHRAIQRDTVLHAFTT